MRLQFSLTKIWNITSLFCLVFLGNIQAQTTTCRLFDAKIRNGGICQGGGETILFYGFSKENIIADSFDVFVDEEWQETKKFDSFNVDNYNSTFLITPGIRQLTICVQGDSNCCVTTSFIAPNCDRTLNCVFDTIIARPHSCQEDGRFFLDIEFQTPIPLSDSFRILDKEIDYGIFEYGQPFYTIGPIENIPDKRYEFILQDSENETCRDTNFDNVVDNFDLANISLIFGAVGPPRQVMGIEFTAKTAPDWEGQFSDGLNFKHADCNGDGIINEADVEAIRNNYFFSHGDRPIKLATNEAENAPILFVDFPELSVNQEGETITSPIIFGGNDLPATAYGLAFTVVFDPDLLKNGTVVFTDNWLGTTADDLLIVNQNISSSGLIEVAIGKKNTMNSIGDGPIGNLIVIIDNIEAYNGGNISLENVRVLDEKGTSLAVHAPPTEIIINQTTSNYTLVKESTAIHIYPNPVKKWLNLEFSLTEKIEAIHIRNISGQLVQSLTANPMLTIPTGALVDGIYFLEVQTDKGKYFKKFLKQ